MNLIITGGGTGGHIYPALAVAEELKKRGWKILYLGADHRMEAEIVPQAGYDFVGLPSRSLPRKLSLNLVSSLVFNIKSFFKALKIIKDFKADLVFGTGGFVAGPVMFAAFLLKKKTIIHEQNAYPGITNKLLAVLVDKICLNFGEAEKFLKTKTKKIEITGNPVRTSILNVNSSKAYQELKLKNELKTVLITGGSLGAEIINQNLILIYKYALKNNIQIIHLTGKKNYKRVVNNLKNKGIEISNPLIRIIDYLDQMEYALAAADLIISRAGATALAEITSSALPAILIPFAAAAENHQLFNAKTLADKGAALIITEDQINNKILLKKFKSIIDDENKRLKMSQAAEKMSQKNALTKIIKVINDIVF